MGKKNELEDEKHTKKTNDDNFCETEELEDNNITLYEEQKNVDVENMAMNIHQALVEYSEGNAFPLCEYLEVENVFVFVDYLTHKF